MSIIPGDPDSLEIDIVTSIEETELLVVEPVEPVRFRPWLAVFLTLVVFIAYFLAQTFAVIGILIVETIRDDGFDVEAWLEQAPSLGFLLAICTLCSMLVVVPLVLIFAGELSSLSRRDYLGLHWPTPRSAFVWIAALLAIVVATDGVTWLLGLEVVPSFMHDAYSTSGAPILFWFALIVGAPVGEELIFRGLVFRALVESRLGLTGTAVFTSLTWALIHVQYDLYGMAIIFVLGLLLAAARQASQSVLLCILMHSIVNLIATIQVALAVGASQEVESITQSSLPDIYVLLHTL